MIVAGGALAHRAASLILRSTGVRISCGRAGHARDTGGMEARAERRLRRTRTRARGARARARRGAGGQRRDRPRRRARRASARPGSRPSSRARARDAGFEVLLGRSIDLVGTELPYQPFVEALRPLGDPFGDGPRARSCGCSRTTLALLTERAAAAPVLLVLEDLHWADTSTLDLVVFLAHNLDDRRGPAARDLPRGRAVVGRAHAPARRRRPALGLGARARARTARARRADGAARGPRRRAAAGGADGRDRRPLRGQPVLRRGAPRRRRRRRGELPRGLRDLLLQRVARLDRPTQSLLRAGRGRRTRRRLPAAARRRRRCPERDVRESLRRAVEHGVLVADQATRQLPLPPRAAGGGDLRDDPARRARGAARAARRRARAQRRRVAGGARAALGGGGSQRRRRWPRRSRRRAQAEAVFGLAEARAHLERALALWAAVPDAAELAGLDLAELCAWAAELASQTGAAPRAVELARRAIELVGDGDPHRAALLHVRLGEYLYADRQRRRRARRARARGRARAGGAALAGARVRAGGRSAGGLMLAWRHDGVAADRASRRSRSRAASAHGEAEVRALTVLGGDLAYLGRGEEGLAQLRQALQLAEEIGDPVGLERAYVNLTDVLTMLGRPRESARLAAGGARGDAPVRRSTAPCSSRTGSRRCSRSATGTRPTGSAPPRSAASPPSFPYMAAHHPRRRSRSAAASSTPRERTSRPRAPPLREDRGLGLYDALPRRARPLGAPLDGRRRGRRRRPGAGAARARPPRSASGSAPRDCARRPSWPRSPAPAATPTPLRDRLARAGELLAAARRAAAEASAITPNADGWLALAEAEHERARGDARPEPWSDAADTWERLERPPLAAYCRWRQAEALVAAGASRAEASAPLARRTPSPPGSARSPLLRELELLAERARLDLDAARRRRRRRDARPRGAPRPDAARGGGAGPRRPRLHQPRDRRDARHQRQDRRASTSRTSCASSTRPNRLEAAAIAHRLAPPEGGA